MDDQPVSTDPQLDMDDMMEGMAEETHLSEMNGESNEHGSIDRDKVIIIDGQAVVQSMTKHPGIDTICDLGDAVVKRIDRMTRWYTEGRVIFDRYINFPVPYFSITFSLYGDDKIYLVVITTPQWLTYLDSINKFIL